MEHYFELWLENAYSITVGDDEFQSMNSEQQLFSVGKAILSMDNSSTLYDMQEKLVALYGGDLSLCSRDSIIELLLVYAMSENCDYKTALIDGIMTLDTNVQTYLMQIIQNNLQGAQDDSCDVDDDQFEPVFEVVNTHKDTDENACFLNQNHCRQCAENLVHIQHLQQELKQRYSEEHLNILKLKENAHLQSSNTVNAELEIVELNAQLREKAKHIQDCEKKIQDLVTEVDQNAQMKVELLELRDQLDVLKLSAERLDAAETKNEKLKSKLEELKDIKHQLNDEHERHSETFAKFSELQLESDALRKLKPQLDQYRAQCTELVIAADELKLRLSSKDDEISRLQRLNESLAGGQEGSHLQTQNLLEELREREEQLRELQRTGGVGEGMSEMNSEVMQEMHRLKTDNKRLLQQLDSSSLESLSVLEKDLTDQRNIAASLQKKLLSTKDALESALKNIDSLKEQLVRSQAECRLLSQQSQETSIAHATELDALQSHHQVAIDSLASKHSDIVSVLTKEHAETVTALRKTIEQISEALSNTENEVIELTASNCERQRAVEELTEQLCHANNEKVRLMDESAAKESELREECRLALETQRASAADEMAALTSAHHEALAMENRKVLNMTADLEEEGVKRRKVERKSKFHEAEAQRLKTQLQMACGANASGSGGDVDSAIKELGVMQRQLDAANAELVVLRAQAHSHATDSGLSHSTDMATGSALRGPVRGDGKEHVIVNAAVHGAGPPSTAQGGLYGYNGYLEQAELSDKRIEQLTREKREMISKTLEENKEKMELAQKLLMSEKEVSALQTKLRQLTLDKERAERKLLQKADKLGLQGESALVNDENVANRAYGV